MSGSVRGLSDRGKTVKRVLLVLLILAVLAGGGYFGYLKYTQIQVDKHDNAGANRSEADGGARGNARADNHTDRAFGRGDALRGNRREV